MDGPDTSTGAAVPSPAEATQRVHAKALSLGFSVVGVARADEALDVDIERYERFVEQGLHGTMAYVAENAHARKRLDTSDIVRGAQSVICVGRRYERSTAAEAADPPFARRIARYARGQDYHVFLRKKLRRLAAFVRQLGPSVRARAFCDVEPVLERAWAARAGIGFVGKNGMIITPGQGSYQILGEVVTTLKLIPDTPIGERCGACSRCLDACPTQAFRAPFVLDPRRCIAYLTIENIGVPPEDLRDAIGEHLFGCDECQDVCPWNRASPPSQLDTRPFQPLARWASTGLDDLVRFTQPEWDRAASGSPLFRARRNGMARNAVIVAANLAARGDASPAEQRTLAAASAHDDSDVRTLSAWAKRKVARAPHNRNR